MSISKKQKEEAEARLLSRRAFLGGAAAGTYLLGCSPSDYAWNTDEAQQSSHDTKIVRAAIHPGIGVARIGNSTKADGYFIGPEVVEPALTMAGASHDAAGAMKRQAARFRIYGYNAAGEIVGEITPDQAKIEWHVHLANKKAQWYRFLVALDVPEAVNTVSPRRNAGIGGDARSSLAIDPGPRTIRGKCTSGSQYQFDGARFMGAPVSLGEVRTDDDGRLLVLGGRGTSGSPTNSAVFNPADADSFNNADNWYDDIADGPVSATVVIGGRDVPVEAAWVVVAPPNYAPNVVGWRTLHDLLVDTYVDAGMLALPETTSFVQDVLPALRRLADLQWVNQGFEKSYGRGSPHDFDDPILIQKLASSGSESADLRRAIEQSFRPASSDKRAWPPLYGDAYGSFDTSPAVDLAASKLRSLHLSRWAEGKFVDDWTTSATPFKTLADVPGWVATGDAALSFDSISSQGIFNALYTGMTCGEAVRTSLRGDASGVHAYVGRLEAIRAAYLERHLLVYAGERRWTEARFWRRRHGLARAL